MHTELQAAFDTIMHYNDGLSEDPHLGSVHRRLESFSLEELQVIDATLKDLAGVIDDLIVPRLVQSDVRAVPLGWDGTD